MNLFIETNMAVNNLRRKKHLPILAFVISWSFAKRY